MKLLFGFILFMSASGASAGIHCSVKETGATNILWEKDFVREGQESFRLNGTKLMLSFTTINGEIQTLSADEDDYSFGVRVVFDPPTKHATLGFIVVGKKVPRIHYDFVCDVN